MRDTLKFKTKTGDYKVCNYDKSWRTETGTHYLHYPFMIYKRKNYWVLTHMSSGSEICTTRGLKVAKYIATRLLPVPQFLLPNGNLVEYMTQETKRYCMDMIGRYRDVAIKDLEKLDKICPFTI